MARERDKKVNAILLKIPTIQHFKPYLHLNDCQR
ncbi:hypothetical protein NC651_030161 [Populus alba x Populus x berolinensis]|nr:hypothetical protein NC651_030161 [Populus alba x Populus x berolinensis]